MYLGPKGRTRSLPVSWTDVAPLDGFVSISAGRAAFRVEDLLSLIVLIRDIRSSKEARQERRSKRVK